MRAYDHSIRKTAIGLYKEGKKKTEISQQLSVNYGTILRWINRFEKEGDLGLKPRYGNCGGHSKVDELVKSAALKLKSAHRGWGGAYIRMKLKQTYPDSYIPSGRQLQRYFKKAGLLEEQTKLPVYAGDRHWARKALHRVQVDAKEQIQTQDKNWCSYLTFTDEYTGAVLEALVFPL